MNVHMVDVVIVGAGPAGLAAGAALRRLGAGKVVVVEREPEPGGIPRLCHHTGFGLYDLRRVYSGPAYARHYVRQAERAGTDLWPTTTITGWAGPLALSYTSPRGLGRIEARAVLLATGCRERPRSARLVPGDRPAGVFTTGSLQRFVYEQHLPVGRRAVIVGAELVSLSALMTLQHAGVAIACLATELPHHQVYLPYLPAKWWLADLRSRTPIRTSTRLTRILGQGRVAGVELTDLRTGTAEVCECDTVVFTAGWVPEQELARLGDLAIDAGTRGPQADASMRTSRPGVFAAGNLLHGAETADQSALEGRRAGRHVACYLETGGWPEAGLPVEISAPIEWIFPNRLASPAEPPPAGHFALRVAAAGARAVVAVDQGDRRLHTQAFRRLQPGTSMALGRQWLSRLDPHGPPVQVHLLARPDQFNGTEGSHGV